MTSIALKRLNSSAVKLSAVISVLAVAFFFRVYQQDSVPPGLFHDEAVNGLDIFNIFQGQHSLFFEANNGREPLF